MTGLRIVLLAVALAVFAAVGWKVSETPSERIAAAPAAPIVPAPAVPAAPAPAVPTPNPTPQPGAVPQSVAPHAPVSPASPAAPVPAAPPATSPAPASTGPASPAPAPPADTARAAVMAAVAAAPDLARAFSLLQAEFPAVAERAVTASAAAAGKDAMPPADDIVAGAMRDLRLSSGVLAARAGPDALAALFDAKAATLSDLQAADPRMCADYVFGGSSPEFNDFAIAHRALVARQDIATIAAMADGRTRRMNYDAPTPDDFAALEAALKGRGLSPTEIAAVLDGKSPDPPLPDARVCANARAYLEAMRSLPADSRNRIYGLAADLLARS